MQQSFAIFFFFFHGVYVCRGLLLLWGVCTVAALHLVGFQLQRSRRDGLFYKNEKVGDKVGKSTVFEGATFTDHTKGFGYDLEQG